MPRAAFAVDDDAVLAGYSHVGAYGEVLARAPRP